MGLGFKDLLSESVIAQAMSERKKNSENAIAYDGRVSDHKF
ncbi:hypothetical protein [uncultured Nostoc sp.]